MREPEFEDIQAELSITQELTSAMMSRRAFLATAAAGIGIAMMPDWLHRAAAYAAPPIGANDGVLVVLQLGGGNDGLNTVVPTGLGTYYDKRKTLAISADSALNIAPGVGLHPSLAKLKARYDSGKVAVVQGVSYPQPNLSHFDSTATWMTGWGSASGPRNGWLGRYLDELGGDPLFGVNVGTSVPLHMQGSRTAATSLPFNHHGLFASNQSDAVTRRMAEGIKQMGVARTGYGSIADEIAALGRSAMTVTETVSPCFTPTLPSGRLVGPMELCARLINANLGIRVLSVSYGSFDLHSNAAGDHAARLREVDDAIETFFTTLAPHFAGRTTLMTFSEFGRRVEVNGSSGTDHGTAAPLFVIGDAVRGGLHGAQPSLTSLDSNGNMVPAVDFRTVYASVADKWLGADSNALLGSTFTALDLFKSAPGGGPSAPPPSGALPPPAPAPALDPLPSNRPISWPHGYRVTSASGTTKALGGASSLGSGHGQGKVVGIATTPDQRGYWLVTEAGNVLTFGTAENHGSMAGRRLNAPIVGMASSATGKGYWLLGQDGGVFTFGDAAFYGSTGHMRLNKPVVGMASNPTGGGYWFVASDGGVFSFGPNADFFGSTGSIRLNQPIVGMCPTPTGRGYWMVATDGGIFAFGDARFHGSTGGIKLNQPVVGMAATPSGRGYRLASADGGIFNFGDATFQGSAVGASSQPIVGIVT